MVLFDDIKTKEAANVFKGQDVLVAVAPYATAALNKAALFDSTTGAIKALPVGWRQIGWTDPTGVAFGRDTTISDTQALGALEPILRDVTAVSKTLSVVPLESNRTVAELYYMADLSSTPVVPDAHNVIEWLEPDLPRLRDWRLIAIGKWENSDGEWYKAVQYPRAFITSNGDENWNRDDSGNTHPLVANAQLDGTLGYAVGHFEGGPGFPATEAGYV